MAKPRLLRNGSNPKGPEDGAKEEGGAVVAKGRGTEGGGAKWRVEHDTHPPTRRASSWHREVHPARDRGEETEQEPEGVEEVGGGDGETPRAPLVEVTCVGRDATPQRKMRTSWDSPQNMRTWCCRESMETFRITIMGFTWTGELKTTLHGSVAGSGSLRNQQAGMPLPMERWGAASRRSWRRNGGG